MPKASTSTAHPSPLEQALAKIPLAFRSRLLGAYLGLKRNHAEGRNDAAGLSTGKLCEICLRWLQHEIFSTHTPFSQRIPNFADECRRLVTSPASAGVESLRIVIPRALVFLYTMRSKRGIGHVGGDVDANRIDVATMARVADWIVCELIRIYHPMSLEDAQDLVDSLSSRDLPDVWEVAGKKRVLRKGLSKKDEVLLLLYSDPASVVLSEDLRGWVDHPDLAVFRRDVLRPLHRARLVEYDDDLETVQLSPSGTRHVEERILRVS